MGTYRFRLPDIGEGVAEAEIVAWHIAVGDTVAEDDPLCDVMTDKATVDIGSPVAGKVTAVNGAVGDLVSVGSVLVEFAVTEDADGAQIADPAPGPEPLVEQEPATAPTPAPTGEEAPRFPLAAPATRRMAQKMGVDLGKVIGSGRNGRVTPEDIDEYLKGGSTQAAPRKGSETVQVVGLRRKVAERMAASWARVPHITYVEEFDLTELEALRAQLNEERGARPKLSILPFFVRALVKALPAFPDANAHYDDEAGTLTRHRAVHVGIATATAGGLMVPVLRHAESLDLWQTATQIARLASAARDGSAARDTLSGSTITITSLGPLGGIATTPIINRPETAIIGPNKLTDKLVGNGAFVAMRKVMNVSSAFDHRIIDGEQAARLVQALRRLLEHPALLFVD